MAGFLGGFRRLLPAMRTEVFSSAPMILKNSFSRPSAAMAFGLGATGLSLGLVSAYTQPQSMSQSTGSMASSFVGNLAQFKVSDYSGEQFKKLSGGIREQLIGRNQDVSPEIFKKLLDELLGAISERSSGSQIEKQGFPLSIIKEMGELAAHVGNIQALEVLVEYFGVDAVRSSSKAAELLDLSEDQKVHVRDVSDQFSGLGRIKHEGIEHAFNRMKAHEEETIVARGRLGITGLDPEVDFTALSTTNKQLREVEGAFSRLVVIDSSSEKEFSSFLEGMKLYSESRTGEEIQFNCFLTGSHFTYGQFFVTHLGDSRYKVDVVYFDSLGAAPGSDPLDSHIPEIVRYFPEVNYFVSESVLQYAPKGCSIFVHEMLKQAVHPGYMMGLKDSEVENNRDYALRNTVLSTYYPASYEVENFVDIPKSDGSTGTALKEVVEAKLFPAPPGYRRLTQSFSRKVDDEMHGFVQKEDGLYHFGKLPETTKHLEGHQGLVHHSPKLTEELRHPANPAKGKEDTHQDKLSKHTKGTSGKPVNATMNNKVDALRPKLVEHAKDKPAGAKPPSFSATAFEIAARREHEEKGKDHGPVGTGPKQ